VKQPDGGARQALAIGLFGTLMMGLLALYLYPLGGLGERWLLPFVVRQEDFYDEPFLVFNAVVLLWLPLLFTFFALPGGPGELGFARGDWRAAGRWTVALYLLMLPVVVVAAHTDLFQHVYPLRSLVRQEPRFRLLPFLSLTPHTIYYELTYGFYFFCWEWFFRGFLLFGLARGCGRWAILLQAVPFGFFHWGKPAPEIAGSFIAGLILGELALRARSFLPCFVLHWAVAVTLDLLVLSSAHPIGR
jgi:membrane protease YdiL (CAAX protease family)